LSAYGSRKNQNSRREAFDELVEEGQALIEGTAQHPLVVAETLD
jgi:hypothetical protein